MSNVGDMNFVTLDLVKDEIAIARNDDNAAVCLVNFASLVWIMFESARSINQPGDHPRGLREADLHSR
jgi:hypothetical protein